MWASVYHDLALCHLNSIDSNYLYALHPQVLAPINSDSFSPHRFVSKMFHPNVYADGGICLDILQNRWSPTYDVSAILTSIQSLLDEPNPNSPANSVAAQLYQVSSDWQDARQRLTVNLCCRKTDENTRRGWRLWWSRAGWYSPRRRTVRRTGARPRLRSEGAWHLEAGVMRPRLEEWGGEGRVNLSKF